VEAAGAGGVMSCIICLGNRGGALASRVGLLGRFTGSIISFFLFPRGSF